MGVRAQKHTGVVQHEVVCRFFGFVASGRGGGGRWKVWFVRFALWPCFFLVVCLVPGNVCVLHVCPIFGVLLHFSVGFLPDDFLGGSPGVSLCLFASAELAYNRGLNQHYLCRMHNQRHGPNTHPAHMAVVSFFFRPQILLLGPGEAGKSTVLKQLKCIYKGGIPLAEQRVSEGSNKREEKKRRGEPLNPRPHSTCCVSHPHVHRPGRNVSVCFSILYMNMSRR